MPAAIWHMSGQQSRDVSGKAYVKAVARFYVGGTTTPMVVFADNALTTPLGVSVVSDGFGTWPPVFIPVVGSQTFGYQIVSAKGVQLYSVPAINPAPSASSGGGGGGGTVDPTAIFQTGDMIWIPVSAARSGWVRCNARTVGSPGSGANERANSDTQALFTYLWANYTDAVCPVSGGRGASAAADWTANKNIAVPDMRGFSAIGLDDMGNTAAARFAGVPFVAGTATTPAATAGENAHVLTVPELAAHTHSISGSTDTQGNHTHPLTFAAFGSSTSGSGQLAVIDFPASTGAAGAHTHSVTGTAASVGNNAAHNTMHLSRLGTFYIKL